jgi:putative ABC transport system substrate-binding protein
MRRREFMAGALVAALASRASAQTSAAVRRLAIFEPAVPAENWRRATPAVMFEQLKLLKFAEGENLKVEYYGKEENTAGLEALAAKVVASNPDVIYVDGVGGQLFQGMTSIIPIVVLSSDLVGQGLVKSLAHPRGNITGVAVDTGPAVWGKRIALLREMVPAMTKLAFINPPAFTVQGHAIQAAAEAARIALILVPIAYPAAEADYRAALAAASGQGADAILFTQHPQTIAYAALLAELAAAARLPAIYPFRENVEAGGLMAYSEDMAEIFRRAGVAIAAILNGAKPADIPVEQPSRFLLTINLTAARALGLDPPPSPLAAANEVIE